mmetsp:Transcript_44781/g.126486  ORF Transcript_44781/g.126486 Transcript_44781/m.126486 type:complete len:279 (+) Transcript_44781:285-1121(+)
MLRNVCIGGLSHSFTYRSTHAEYSSNVATFPGLTSGSHEPPSTCADGESSSNVATFPGLTSEPYEPHGPLSTQPSSNVATFPSLTSEPDEPWGFLMMKKPCGGIIWLTDRPQIHFGSIFGLVILFAAMGAAMSGYILTRDWSCPWEELGKSCSWEDETIMVAVGIGVAASVVLVLLTGILSLVLRPLSSWMRVLMNLSIGAHTFVGCGSVGSGDYITWVWLVIGALVQFLLFVLLAEPRTLHTGEDAGEPSSSLSICPSPIATALAKGRSEEFLSAPS